MKDEIIQTIMEVVNDETMDLSELDYVEVLTEVRDQIDTCIEAMITK